MPSRLRFLLSLAFCLVTLTGCIPSYDDGDDVDIPGNFPAFELSIRQSPNDTVRVGETVRYTAVFPDSTSPNYEVTWFGLGIPLKKGRTVEIVPQQLGRIGGEVIVDRRNPGASVSRGFSTVVLP